MDVEPSKDHLLWANTGGRSRAAGHKDRMTFACTMIGVNPVLYYSLFDLTVLYLLRARSLLYRL